jgi:hypothetical protein
MWADSMIRSVIAPDATDVGAFIAGQTLVVNGGFTTV